GGPYVSSPALPVAAGSTVGLRTTTGSSSQGSVVASGTSRGRIVFENGEVHGNTWVSTVPDSAESCRGTGRARQVESSTGATESCAVLPRAPIDEAKGAGHSWARCAIPMAPSKSTLIPGEYRLKER